MTPSEAEKLLPIIKAYAEGQRVQRGHYDGRWTDMTDSSEWELAGDPARYRIAPAKVRVKGWLNVYEKVDGSGVFTGHVHETRQDADIPPTPDRLACIEIDVEGERLG